MENLINIGLILTYLMIGIGALIAVFFGIKKIFQDSKNAKKTIYSLGGLLIILILSYVLASSEVLASYEKYNITEEASKRVGMGLTTFYILSILAIGIIIYTEISKVFSK